MTARKFPTADTHPLHGDFLDNGGRLIGLVNSPNKYAIVDAEDFPQLTKAGWIIGRKGYVRSRHKACLGLMHRVVLGVVGDDIVDHINGNKLDNRKINLRKCSTAENSANRGPQRNNKTGVKGVSIHKKRFYAQIRVKGKNIYLGLFDDLEEAAKARRAAEEKYQGDFAWRGVP